jgi:Predicted membrane protein (DUF2079)
LLVPTIAYSLLSTYPLQYDIHYHYATPLIPLLFACAIYALCRLHPPWRLPVAALLLASVIIAGQIIGPLPWQRGFSASIYVMGPREQAMSRLVSLVPPNARLAVDNQMGAHLTERPWVVHFFTGYETADALLFDLLEESSPDLPKRLRAIEAIERDPTWRLVARDHDVVLYERRTPAKPHKTVLP